MGLMVNAVELEDTPRILNLRERVREAMKQPPVAWDCPERIAEEHMADPLPVRKARAIELKLSRMPTDLWEGQLLAGSMTLEAPRVHAEWGFPDYLTDEEREEASRRGLGIRSVFGHIVPDYGRLLHKGLNGIRADAEAQLEDADGDEAAFLRSAIIALDAVMGYAARLADRCEREAQKTGDPQRATELRLMADNLRQVPAGPAKTFHQALQSVWLLHMVFHSTMNGNALGRLDQYIWPYLETDMQAGRIDHAGAAELVACFCLKFNERAKTTDEQLPESREPEDLDFDRRTRHYTSSQIGTRRDRLDATNHWLQNIVIGGLTPDGKDGTNPLTYLLLEAYRRNEMTNPLLTVRVHRDSPEELLRAVCEVLKDGGGMPAVFNDQALVPALERLGIPTPDARDYTNDGCWEVIIPGRTDFKFQRLSLMLCLEWALNRGRSRRDGSLQGVETPDAREFTSFDEVWDAFTQQVDHMVARVTRNVVENIDERSTVAPVPLLSALLDGPIEKRRDMTGGGAKYRTFGMLAESAAHAIDSLTAIESVIFEEQAATMPELCDALDADFRGYETLRAKLLGAPKYGNADEKADTMGRRVIEAFADAVARHAERHEARVKFPCGVGTFSWYIGIGEGLGASADGRREGEPVSSNFSPALGRDVEGVPAAILSYGGMQHDRLPAGGPLDLRMLKRLVEGDAGTDRMTALIRAFVESGGSMMTLTVADTEELRAAQREPENYGSLRVRMGGWCAYFTMLSREQQDHHIRRQEGGL
ncbi:MAG: pyruvate formate lyase family protein [Candidatus Brocadiia bacterium]